MKKKILIACTALAAGFLLLTSSCGSGLTGTPADKDLSSPEGVKAIKEKVLKNYGADKKVYALSLHATDHMTNEFGMAIAQFIENEKDMSQSLVTQPDEKLKEAEAARVQNEFLMKNKQGSVALNALDFGIIPAKVKEAEALIPKEYEGFTLHDWSFEVSNDNKISADFTLEGGKKGESSERKGRMIVTNYYEFNFTMDETGKVSIRE